ncbi:hypothetical protein [Actinomadura sp. 9N215]|uniref:nSTAND1 domain-containing NTPase n=1 Tax=Actinomadura sp. 9N215 TaxID=3375150 RepID=UPI003794F698
MNPGEGHRVTAEAVSGRSFRPLPGGAECPYQGLAPFATDRSELFFGRTRATRNLLDRLAPRLRERGTILLVSGASGVGKSSLLKAGLIPALAEGALPVAGSEKWPRLLVTPGSDPWHALSAAWTQAFGGDPGETRARLLDDPRQVFEGAGRVILVVDQFEELFTLVTDEAVRQAYVEALHVLATGPAAAAVVIGLRADYWDRCAAYPRFARAIQDGQVIVEPMAADDLRLAITGPAGVAGLEIEPGLVETILDELHADRAADRGHDRAGGRYEVGALPLLSQALRNTWERREDGRLTIRGYEESGRVRDAVRRTANGVLENLSPDDRKTALRLFRRMTLITPGGRLARRRATLAELHAAASAATAERRDRVTALLSAFADRRLLTLDEDAAEISHDALLTAWPTLHQWIEPDLTAQNVYDRLISDAEAWQRHHRDPDMLYRGARLLSVQDSRPRWDRDPASFPPPGPTVSAFLAASARSARQAGRRRRLITASLAALTVLAVIAATAAVRAAGNAGDQRRLAVSRQLAVQSGAAGDADVSALLAVAAWESAPTPEARYALIASAARPGRGKLTGHGDAVRTMAFSPDGKTIATASDDRTVRFWDSASHAQLGAPLGPPRDSCSTMKDLDFSPDGRTLAVACLDTVTFWDVASHRPHAAPVEAAGIVNAVDFSPDGRLLATGLSNGAVQLWNAAARRPDGELLGKAADSFADRIGVETVQFSPDGKILFSGHGDGRARSWDVGTRAPTGTFAGHREGVTDLAVSPDGRSLATVGYDMTARIWDTSTRKQSGALRTDRPNLINSIAYSPDGTRIVTGSSNGRTQLWDARGHGPVGPYLIENAYPVEEVAFSPTGRLYAAASRDGIVRLADPVTFQQTGATIRAESALAVSPDGRTLATGGPTLDDPLTRLWDVASQRPIGEPLRPTEKQKKRRNPYASQLWFGPDGRTLFANDPDGVRTWDVASQGQRGPVMREADRAGVGAVSPNGGFAAVQEGEAIVFRATGDGREIRPKLRVPGFTEVITAMEIGPDAKTLVASGYDRTARVFDVATGRQVGRPLPFKTDILVNDIAFSPDGRVVAVTADDSSAQLWDLARGRLLAAPHTDQTEAVTALAFSPDGRTLATGSMDNTIRLWDLRSLRQIGTPLTGHTRNIVQIAYAADGRTVASIGQDGTARLWNVTLPSDLVSTACANAGRSLTRAEWERYAPREDFPNACR